MTYGFLALYLIMSVGLSFFVWQAFRLQAQVHRLQAAKDYGVPWKEHSAKVELVGVWKMLADGHRASMKKLHRRAQKAESLAYRRRKQHRKWRKWCLAAWRRIDAVRKAHGDQGHLFRHSRRSLRSDHGFHASCKVPGCAVCFALRDGNIPTSKPKAAE